MNKRLRNKLRKRHEAVEGVIKLFKVLEDAEESIESATVAEILGLKGNAAQGTQAKLEQAEAAAKMVGGTIRSAWTRRAKRWAKTRETAKTIEDLERYRDAVGEDAGLALDFDDVPAAQHERSLVIEALIVRDHGWVRSMTIGEARAMIDEKVHLHANCRSIEAIGAIRVEGAHARRPSDGTPDTPWADPRRVARATIAWGTEQTLAVRIASAEHVERRVITKNPRNQVMRARIARDLGDLTGWTTDRPRTRTRFVSELASYEGDRRREGARVGDPPPHLGLWRQWTLHASNAQNTARRLEMTAMRDQTPDIERLRSEGILGNDEYLVSSTRQRGGATR